MIEDMTLCKLAHKTQSAYIRVIKNLANYLCHSPATASSEEEREYQLHLAKNGMSRMSLIAIVTGLRFLYTITLGRHDVNVVTCNRIFFAVQYSNTIDYNFYLLGRICYRNIQ